MRATISIIALLSLLLPVAKADVDWHVEVISKATSPSGKYQAELTKKTGTWGFGLAAVSCEIKLTKLGPKGWFYTTGLEFDSINMDDGCPNPSIDWVAPNELHVLIVTRNVSGRITRRNDDLIVTREYMLISDHLKEQGIKPNQALEPTSTAVTPAPAGKPPADLSRRSESKADAGDRASGTRGSP